MTPNDPGAQHRRHRLWAVFALGVATTGVLYYLSDVREISWAQKVAAPFALVAYLGNVHSPSMVGYLVALGIGASLAWWGILSIADHLGDRRKKRLDT